MGKKHKCKYASLEKNNPYTPIYKEKMLEHYEKLIAREILPKTGIERLIFKLTQEDAGVVLSVIGLEHPASFIVFQYLKEQKYQEAKKNGSGIQTLIRRFFI